VLRFPDIVHEVFVGLRQKLSVASKLR